MLKIKNLEHKFVDFDLETINLELPSSSVLGILGANGAGKSTLIKLLSQALDRQKGEVIFNGELDYRHTTAYAPSEFSLNPNHTIKEVEKMMSFFYKDWDQEAFDGYCGKYALNKADKLKKLSLGMKQRLMIAVSLSHKSKLVILDEVTEGIDPFVRDEIMNDLREYLYKYEPVLIVASHNLEQYEMFLDHVLYLEKGKILLNEDIISFKENANNYLEHKIDKVSLSEFSLQRQKEQAHVKNN